MGAVALTLDITGDGGTFALTMTSKKKLILYADGDGGSASIVFDRTGLLNTNAEYRLVVSDVNGTRYAELDRAIIGSMSWTLNGVGNLSFSLPDNDPKLAECQPVSREIQVWRNGQVIWCGPIVRAARAEGQVDFQCSDLLWYFTRRIAGDTPKTNVLLNPGFEDDDLSGWHLGCNKVSRPYKNPVVELITNDTVTGTIYRDGSPVPGQALKIYGDTTQSVTSSKTYGADSWFTAINGTNLKSGGKKAIKSYSASLKASTMSLVIEGHGDNTSTIPSTLAQADAVKAAILARKPTMSITTVGYGSTRTAKKNTTSANKKANRRIIIRKATTKPSENLYQYVWQQTNVRNLKASKKSMRVGFTGWYKVVDGAFVKNNYKKTYLMMTRTKESNGKVVQTVTQKLTTTRGIWTRIDAGIMVPSDDIEYIIRVYLMTPVGQIIWDETNLSVSESMSYSNMDQATIVEQLVQYAQDPAHGKSDLNIGTECPLTGKLRSRDIDVANREIIYDAFMEMATFIDGCDIGIDLLVSGGVVSRTLRTYFPLKGGSFASAVSNAPVLALGSNIGTYGADWDGEDSANAIVIVATADDNGAADEASMTDANAFGSLILEKAYTAVPGSSLSSLSAQAARGIRRYAKPSVTPSITTMPEYADELFDTVKTGTLVRVVLNDNYLNIDGYYRPTEITLDPNTDVFTYTLQPEYI